MEKLQIKKRPLFRSRPPLSVRPQPYLVITHGHDDQRQTFYNLSEGRYYIGIIPELHNKLILECRHGWLVLEDKRSDDCSLLNIVTMEKVQLPPLLDSATQEYETCILTSAPSDPNCRVMLFDGTNKRVLICKPGDEAFVQQEIDLPDYEEFTWYFKSATFLQGKIYGLLVPQFALVTADLREPAYFREVQLEVDPLLLLEGSHSYLVESCGEILLVRRNSLGMSHTELLDFEVFQANFSKGAWVKMTSIGDRVIFLNWYQGFSCSTAGLGGVRRNSIYYSYDGDRNMYVFDLEDQSISLSLPCPIVSSRFSTLSWIMMPGTNTL